MTYRTTSSITVNSAPPTRRFATGPGATGATGSTSPDNAWPVPAPTGSSAGSHHLGTLQGLGAVQGSSRSQTYVTLDGSDEDESQFFAPSTYGPGIRMSTTAGPLPQQAWWQVRQLLDTLDRLDRPESLATVARLEKGLQDRGLRLTDFQVNGPPGRFIPLEAPRSPPELMLPPKKKYRRTVEEGQRPAVQAHPHAQAHVPEPVPAQPERPLAIRTSSASGSTSVLPIEVRSLSRHEVVEATEAVQPPATLQPPAVSGFAGPGWETALQRYQPPTADMSVHQREILSVLNARAAASFVPHVLGRCMPNGLGDVTLQALLRTNVLKGTPDGKLVRTSKQVRLEDVMRTVESEEIIQRLAQGAAVTEPGQAGRRRTASPDRLPAGGDLDDDGRAGGSASMSADRSTIRKVGRPRGKRP